MKEKYIDAHMDVAYRYAKLSSCTRRKVGCVIVKNDSILAFGYNGTPPDEDNCCEDENNITKPNVIHAEDNALRKLTRSTESAQNATMFVTTLPCIICAPRIHAAGITTVYYSEVYANTEGLEYLERRGIQVIHHPIKNK